MKWRLETKGILELQEKNGDGDLWDLEDKWAIKFHFKCSLFLLIPFIICLTYFFSSSLNLFVLVILLQLLWDFCNFLCTEDFDSVVVIQQELEQFQNRNHNNCLWFFHSCFAYKFLGYHFLVFEDASRLEICLQAYWLQAFFKWNSRGESHIQHVLSL